MRGRWIPRRSRHARLELIDVTSFLNHSSFVSIVSLLLVFMPRDR